MTEQAVPDLTYRVSATAVNGAHTVPHPHPGRDCDDGCEPGCVAATGVPVTLELAPAGPPVRLEFTTPVPSSVDDMMAQLAALYQELPPPPEPVKATQAQWDLLKLFMPPRPESEPPWFGGTLLTGVPVHIVEDVEESTAWLRAWTAPLLERQGGGTSL